jgi:hypothetical protein
MDYTKVPDSFKEEYDKKFIPRKLSLKEIEDDPVTWAYVILGIRLRIYQAWMIKQILENQRVAICCSRQIGKSLTLGVIAFWASFYNKFPATVENITTFYIMSRDEDTAMELITKIRGLILMGDKTVFDTKGIDHYFSRNYGAPDNSHQISWKHNSSFIKSVPPTDTCVGKSSSIFFIDEAAKLKVQSPYTDKRLYYEVIEPTTSQTNGKIILCSTPNGIANNFADIMDVEDRQRSTEFVRLWFPYTINSEEIKYIDFVNEKRKIMEARGELKLFQQEYLSLFTVTQNSFFEVEDVDNAVNDSLSLQYDSKLDCAMGIDYGMSESRTVLTITALIEGKITLLNQIRFDSNFNENQLLDESFDNSIPTLMKRYGIQRIVADNCPNGDFCNRWMQSKGYPVTLYNFRSNQTQTEDMSRNKGYYRFRTALKAKRLMIPRIPVLIEEMKILEETQLLINVSIKSPRGQLCDTIDSFLLSALPFLEDQTGVTSYVVKEKELPKQLETREFDSEWAVLSESKNNLYMLDKQNV